MIPRLRLDIGWFDLLSALVLSPSNEAALNTRIHAHAPPDAHPVTGLSVRTLFDAILAETEARPVLMSAVTIADMPAIVQAHGRALHIVDIETDTLFPAPQSLRAACTAMSPGIVVIAQLYGGRTAIPPAASRQPGLIVIEDCAQAFDGELTLSDGADIALFSFGPIKTATALGGAIGLFRDAELAQRVGRRIAAYPALPERWFLRRIAKFAGLKILNIPVVYGAFLSVLKLSGRDPEQTIGQMARGFSAGRPIEEAVRQKSPRRMLALLARRLDKWRPGPDATPHLFDQLSSITTLPGSATGKHRWWLAPIMVAEPSRLIAALRKQGYDATRGATSMRAISGDDNAPPPNAAHMMRSIVYLPKPANKAQASQLAAAVETALTTGAR